MKVDFFVAGVQKGGTTALDALLRGHPSIEMPRIKEPHFFDDERQDWAQPDFGPYHAQFRSGKRAGLRGEATPIYVFWPQAIERIASYNRDARIIVLLRHPSFRAYSHWKMEFSRGAETLGFADAIRVSDPEHRRPDRDTCLRVYSYLSRGLYAGQVRRLTGLFPRQQLLFLRTDALWNDVDGTLARVSGFLGVEPFAPLGSPAYVSPVKNLVLPTFDNCDRRFLNDFFGRDIVEVSSLTGLELSDWSEADYFEPMLPAAPTM